MYSDMRQTVTYSMLTDFCPKKHVLKCFYHMIKQLLTFDEVNMIFYEPDCIN